jgi:tetratricopeptide (TPR) repeat protein
VKVIVKFKIMKAFLFFLGLTVSFSSMGQNTSLLDDAKSLYKSDKIEESLGLLNQVLEQEPKNIEALFYRGKCHLVNRSNEEAKRDFEQLITLNYDLAASYFYLGLAYSQMPEADSEAIHFLSKSIELNDDNEYAYFYRGQSYASIQEYDEAIDDFEIVLSLNNRNDEAWKKLAICHFYKENYRAALDAYTKAHELNPEITNEFRLIGVIYSFSGELPEIAIIAYDIEIAVTNDAHSYYLRGEEYRKIEEFEKALKDYNRAISLIDNEPDFYNGRARLKIALDDYRGGSLDGERAITLDPKNVDGYILKATCKMQLEQYSESINLFSKAIDLDPKSGRAFYLRGITYLLSGQIDKGCTD